MARTVIVGGVAGGMSAATRLRRQDEAAEIIVIERGEQVSFANCGMPYYIGGVIEQREDLELQTPDSLRKRFRIDVRVRTEALRIDREQRTLLVRDLATGAEERLGYDSLVLATGARPIRPDIPGIDRALTLRDLTDMDRIVAALPSGAAADGGEAEPAGADGAARAGASAATAGSSDGGPTVVVLGAGFIGLELAENLARRGLGVCVIEAADQVLTPLDVEMAAPVARHLAAHGIEIRTGISASAITPDSVELSDGGRVRADLVIAAVGVQPESQLAAEAGLALGPRQSIAVGPDLRTSDPAIFAVGDVATKRDAIDGSDVVVPLAGSANRHGRLVADVISGRDVTASSVLGTAIVGLFGMQAAVTGWNERRARAAGRDVRAIHSHPFNHATYYPGAQQMDLKLVVDAATDQILGAQGVGGEGVDKRIDVIATAMRGGLRASELADLDLAYAPQFGAAKDPVVMLGMVADNLASGMERSMQWHEVEGAQADGAVLLDVRTPGEFKAGSEPGAINIPLDELRDRADELPAGDVIVLCRVGVRAHTGARILAGMSRPAVVKSGGYLTQAPGR